MIAASNIHYELADRVQGLACGGIEAMLLVARKSRLMDAINEARLRVWRQQPEAFFREAVIDADGTLVATGAECKRGVDIAYNVTWGYQPLVVSLANTQEPLFLADRSGNRPSHELAAGFLDRGIAVCRRAGFRSFLLRGDTDFTQTAHLDRWDDLGDVCFVFGIDAMRNLVELAEALPESAYGSLQRPEAPIRTVPRTAPERHKPRIVRERGFKEVVSRGDGSSQTGTRAASGLAAPSARAVTCRPAHRSYSWGV